MADRKEPHETTVRAGEERLLPWDAKLPQGSYEFLASLIYDLNRYNDPSFEEDQMTIFRRTLLFKVK